MSHSSMHFLTIYFLPWQDDSAFSGDNSSLSKTLEPERESNDEDNTLQGLEKVCKSMASKIVNIIINNSSP